jgi:hypothetical protein
VEQVVVEGGYPESRSHILLKLSLLQIGVGSAEVVRVATNTSSASLRSVSQFNSRAVKRVSLIGRVPRATGYTALRRVASAHGASPILFARVTRPRNAYTASDDLQEHHKKARRPLSVESADGSRSKFRVAL